MLKPSSYHLAYLRTVSLTALGVLSVVAGFNALMDPLWCLGTEHGLNHRKLGFDERQQKTNRLVFREAPFDAVILGSSRAGYLAPGAFVGQRVFNYTASEMGPPEFAAYARFAASRLGPRLKRVYVALDFEATNRHRAGQVPFASPESVFRRVRDPLYRFKVLLSGDAFGQGLAGLRFNLASTSERDHYDPTGLKFPRAASDLQWMHRTTKNLHVFQRRYRHGYRYDPDYAAALREISAASAGARVIAFTPPVSAMFLELLRQEGRLEDYRRWVRESVAAYGGLHHFCYPNSVTRNLRQFTDGQHLQPRAGRWLVARMLGGASEAPADFGVYLTPGNVEAFLADLRF